MPQAVSGWMATLPSVAEVEVLVAIQLIRSRLTANVPGATKAGGIPVKVLCTNISAAAGKSVSLYEVIASTLEGKKLGKEENIL